MTFKLVAAKLLMKFAQNRVLRRFSFKVEPTWKVHTIKQSDYAYYTIALEISLFDVSAYKKI